MKIQRWVRWLAAFAGVLLLATPALAQVTNQAVVLQDKADLAYRAIGLGVAAAFAVGVSVLGAGIAVGRFGSAALGAIA